MVERDSMADKKETAEGDRMQALRHLSEFVAALDRRVPRVKSIGEVEIAHDMAALRKKALRRIASLEAGLIDKSKPKHYRHHPRGGA